VVAQWISPPTTWRFFAQTERPIAAPAVDRLLERIPKDAAVAASSKVASHLARRERLYLFPPGTQGFYHDQPLAEADYVLYETPRPGDADPWTPVLENDPWVLVGVGYYEPKEYRYLYRLYRRRPAQRRAPAGDAAPVARGLGTSIPLSYTSAMEIQGASALVTGAGRGIGRSIALALAQAGAYVTAVSRTAVQLDSLVEQIEAEGGRARAHAGDVCDAQICEGAVKAAASHGRLQILVNNAGIGGFGPLAETSDPQWDRILGTNLTAVFRLTRAALPQLCNGGGHVFMISSLAGSNPIANMAAYCASKAALDHLARCLMLEVRHQGVKVTTIAPGSVDTAFGGMPRDDATDWMLQPEDVASAVLDLLRMRDEAHLSRLEMRPLRPKKRT
jgi:NAD(P)-dependent dehydrogenase (short-subunit alcohol dehydrogenase family)